MSIWYHLVSKFVSDFVNYVKLISLTVVYLLVWWRDSLLYVPVSAYGWVNLYDGAEL